MELALSNKEAAWRVEKHALELCQQDLTVREQPTRDQHDELEVRLGSAKDAAEHARLISEKSDERAAEEARAELTLLLEDQILSSESDSSNSSDQRRKAASLLSTGAEKVARALAVNQPAVSSLPLCSMAIS